jgi:hypothetical protein
MMLPHLRIQIQVMSRMNILKSTMLPHLNLNLINDDGKRVDVDSAASPLDPDDARPPLAALPPALSMTLLIPSTRPTSFEVANTEPGTLSPYVGEAEGGGAVQKLSEEILALKSTNQQLAKDLEAERSSHIIHVENVREELDTMHKQQAEDLETEKLHHRLHVKKVREELGTTHKQEVEALHLKHQKEVNTLKT